MIKTYEIFEGNMDRLEKKLTRVANKCKKYGCDFHYEKVGEIFHKMKDDESGDYMHNLKTVCTASHVTYDNFGILASLIPAYNRAVEDVGYQNKFKIHKATGI